MISNVIAHALKYDLEYCIPKQVNNPHYKDEVPYLFPNVNYCDKNPNLPLYNEMFYHYQEIPPIDNVCFSGYWQSWRYFHDYRDEILKLFGFDDIETKHQYCSLHYRCGDYKNVSHVHPIITDRYIQESTHRMVLNGYKKFLVFSDSIEEVKEILESFYVADGISIEYSEGKSDIEDLRLMASCGSNIIANSTFSWFGAYINPNPNKIVIAPKKWFADGIKHNTKDLLLPEWEIL